MTVKLNNNNNTYMHAYADSLCVSALSSRMPASSSTQPAGSSRHSFMLAKWVNNSTLNLYDTTCRGRETHLLAAVTELKESFSSKKKKVFLSFAIIG